MVRPRVAWGWFRCFSEGDTLVVCDGSTEHRFPFPRQHHDPALCIADFFRSEAEGGDVAGLFVVTIGDALSRETARLYAEGAFQAYHQLHGFGVEVTDALAEYWHETMRVELGIGERRPGQARAYAAQGYQGSRYGFGYPACPDLEALREVFELLQPQAIGVSLTENLEMVPEMSTSALVAHHPQARYFAV
jgi:5-methyltetrahydrofolate--homocysteine methyltransferase